MTDYPMKAGRASQITSNRQVPIIDIATNLPIGYFSAEYLNTRARRGLVFFHAAKAWKILHITDEEVVFVLPSKKLDAIIQNNNPHLNKAIQKKSISASSHGAPTPIREHIIVEPFQNYIIIHSPLGTKINTTLRLAFDVMLTEQDLILDSYNDDTRILIQTPAKLTREEIESIYSDLFHISPREFDRLVLEAIDTRFPPVVAKENRQLKRTHMENTLKGKLRTNLVVGPCKALLKQLTEGKIKVVKQFSQRPTPQAREIIDEHTRTTATESDKLIKENAIKLGRSIERENADLLCLKCLSSQGSIRILNLQEKPKCAHCGSGLLALPAVSAQTIIGLLHKKKSSKLSSAEAAQLAGTRRTADLVLSYGKRAVIALSVTGIGPQTASSILASMPSNESEFSYGLLKARIHYLTTRELWDRRPRRAISLANRVRFNI